MYEGLNQKKLFLVALARGVRIYKEQFQVHDLNLECYLEEKLTSISFSATTQIQFTDPLQVTVIFFFKCR